MQDQDGQNNNSGNDKQMEGQQETNQEECTMGIFEGLQSQKDDTKKYENERKEGLPITEI